jgi:hypothetical protein
MVGQKKHNGSVMIGVKPCQYLHISHAIIYFNIPFCSAQGLQDSISKAMVTQKSLLIKRHPDKWHRMEWSRPLLDFELIRNFVWNTHWRNCEENTTIQAYHKLAWQLECPTEEADRLYKL